MQNSHFTKVQESTVQEVPTFDLQLHDLRIITNALMFAIVYDESIGPQDREVVYGYWIREAQRYGG